ncbi:unnamed protein product (macronuclear) [Paramecium tetraurelia]|uniref:Uncharacterized protein n=1 Tax=Paramecium tetraurelia TaxID=5888 RepID=A0C4H0_PARTE|nr:uncharacterized protein GSPATT00035167001 [Paramecium tetraurelia]CAK65687.1 unnamed protein product [Paramecium tetraurelia]|eukprot:XP_001433084.1 hypothetical protein (macronuclear) [Paramecium tetraurelia strain d4-2]
MEYRPPMQPNREIPQSISQIQQEQRMKFQLQQIQAKIIEERPNFQDMQGGQPPNKPWLGEDIYMVVFLLTVENDRLREENTHVQQLLNTSEMRYKGVDLVENEVISQRVKIGEYEKKLALLQMECEQWRVKYQNRDKESEDQRYQNELQRRIQVDREIRELTARFIADRNQLEQENRSLRIELDQMKLSKYSFEDNKKQCEALQKENQRLKQELDTLKKGFDELEYVLQSAGDLEQENQHLKIQIEQLQKQFQQLQQQQQSQILQRPQSSNKIELSNSNYNVVQENRRLKDEIDRLRTLLNLGTGSYSKPFM